jgi:hypothetical protein
MRKHRQTRETFPELSYRPAIRFLRAAPISRAFLFAQFACTLA